MEKGRNNLLYVSVNDGSEPRICKEIESLARDFEIYYIGIGASEDISFAKKWTKEFNLAIGNHRSSLCLLKYYVLFLKVFFKRNYHSIHIVNEQNYILFIPILIFKKQVVLDIFDSYFLKNKNHFVNRILKDLIYSRVKKIVVTDENRLLLIPEKYRSKCVVIENYPKRVLKYSGKVNNNAKVITIFYYGNIHINRGTEFMMEVARVYGTEVKIKIAGWLYDEASRSLARMSGVEYLGILTQQDALNVASNADFLLCLYKPKSLNDIYASPNKIYDSIQVETPVIINREVLIAEFVERYNLGIVIDSFYSVTIDTFLKTMKEFLSTYHIESSMKERYCWESIESKLLEVHNI
ncbi:MAG: hypothetical protein M3Q56_10035 [Bacteroidota bacterium]|nr:hypothetical protein [Bacteroidota bacterium]